MVYFICEANALPFKIDNINNGSGIYFENLGHVKTTSTKWKMVTYTNISIYYEKLYLINNTYTKSLPLCNNKNLDHVHFYFCQQSLNYLKAKIPYLYSKYQSIEDLVGKNQIRNKRGLFNGIGTIFKTIFGTLDYEDATYFEKAINDVKGDENEMLKLMKEQIHVVKTTIANFNESINNLKFNENTLNGNINKINIFIEKTSSKMNKLELAELASQHVNLLTYLTNELSEELDSIINSILFAKRNILHPSILTPIQLITELGNNNYLLKSGLNFPVFPSIENAHTFMDIADLQVFHINNKLMFIINIPLTDPTIFTLYQCIPLPMPYEDNTRRYAYIQPNVNFLGIPENNQKYVKFHDLKLCKKVSEFDFICQQDVFYSTTLNANCEVVLLTGNPKKIPKNCDTKVFNGDLDIAHKLRANKWILITTLQKQLTVICENDDGIKDITILGLSILTLKDNCEAYFGSNLLKGEGSITAEYEAVIPNVDIIKDDCCEKVSYNISHEYIKLNPITLSNVNLDNLKLVSHTLDNIKEQINQASKHPTLIRYPSIFSSIIYIIIIVITFYILLKCCKRYKNYKNNCQRDIQPENTGCLVQVINKCFTIKEASPVENADLPTVHYQAESPRIAPRRPLKHQASNLGSNYNLSN